MIQSICIVRLSALGDALMLIPLVRTLQANFVNARLTWVISRPAYDLVKNLQDVEFIVIDKPRGLKDYWRFHQKMKDRRFDVLLATQASLRANLLYPLIRAVRKIGFDAERANDAHRLFIRETITPGNDHTLEAFLKFADCLGIADKKITWDIPIDKCDKQWAKARVPKGAGPLILINPAASKPERCWSVANYVAIIHYLQSRWGAKVVLIGGPGDFDRALEKGISRMISVQSLIAKTKPPQLLALIEHAKLLLCPDTGPAHMATAVSTPVVALHAVTNPNVSGPYLYRHLAVNYYPKAVQSLLQKDPKDVVWGTQIHGLGAMNLIDLESVKLKLDEALISCTSFS